MAKEPNAEYLQRLRDLIKSKIADGDVSDADLNAIIRAAAGYSGGKAKARKRQDAAAAMPAKAAESDSLWVGYWLPVEVAQQIAIPGGESPADLHITLAYLGSVADLPADAIERLVAVVQAFAMSKRPVEITLNGAARFDAGDNSNGKDAIYASVESDYDMDGLDVFRSYLCMALCEAGLDAWGDRPFIPHVTLAYVEPGADVSVTLPYIDLTIDSLTVATSRDAGSRQTFMLTGPKQPMMAPLMMSEFIEPPATIPVLPKPGSYEHPAYGTIDMSQDRIDNFVANFNDHVYQEKVPIDLEHQSKLSGAAGYITSLSVNTDGSVDGVVEWTDMGVDALTRDRFSHVSPEWYDEWQSPIGGKDYTDVLIGAALTTRPFFKYKALRPLAASEMPPTRRQEGNTMADDPKAVVVPVAMSEAQIQRFAEMEAKIAELTTAKTAAEALAETNATAVKQAAEQIATMQTADRRKRFTDEVMGRSDSNNIRWFGEPAKHVSILEHIATTAGEDSELFRDHVAGQRATGKAMADSAMFKETGSNGDGSTSADPQERINALANKMASEKSIPMRDAMRQVMSENPELAREAGKAAQVKV